MMYLGDYPASHTAICIPFDSFAAATGAPSAVTNFAASDVQIYKDGGTTQRSSSAGITVSTSFDSSTGLQMVVIDTSDNTDAGFYAAGHEYQVAIADITVDGQTLRFWAASFSIERAGGILALLKGANGVAALKTDTAAIKVVTDKFAFTVANQVDSNVIDWKGSAAPAMTGDAYARIGAAGAGLTALGDTRIAHLDVDVSSRPTAAAVRAEMDSNSVGLAAIYARTDVATSSRLAAVSYTAPDSAATIAAAVWAYVVEGSYSALGFMRGMGAMMMGKASGGQTGSETFRSVTDSKDRVVMSDDASGNRSAVTLDLT